MKIQVSAIGKSKPGETVALSCFVKDKVTSHPLARNLRTNEKRLLERCFRAKEFTGKASEVKVLPRAGSGKILLVGLGERKAWSLRRAVLMARRVVATAKAEKAAQVTLALAPLAVTDLSIGRLAQAVAENAIMAGYEFTKYKQKVDNGFQVRGLTLVVDKSALSATQAGVIVGKAVGEAVNAARDLGNVPGGEMTPKSLADKAREAGRFNKFKVKVFNLSAMKRLKMGAILGVAKGSAETPRFIIMEYDGGKRGDKPVVFVGKGVTFDTGGLNLKPEKGMNDMHLDMSGGAAVISAISAIAKLKLPVNVVGLVPAVENMPGSAGYRPGDLLKSLSGKTIEVLNTDAEGRVILADALAYAGRYQPQALIDVATLTGACLVALGTWASGLMSTNDKLQQEIMAVAEISGDYVWPLPMWEEYEEDVKGTFGDVQNVGKSGYGGAIAGAMFLKQFVGSIPWAHLDIAGPMKTVEGQFLAKGASGVGVRLLVEFARSRVAKKTN